MVKKSLKLAATRVRSAFSPHPPGQYPDWPRLLARDADKWKAARADAKNGPRILIANSAGRDRPVTIIDSLLAVALTLRGADVHVLLCDEALPACWMSLKAEIDPQTFVKTGPSQVCGKCFLNGFKVFNSLGLPLHRYSEFISSEEEKQANKLSMTIPVDEIQKFRLTGMAVGEHAFAGALRYYSRGDLSGEPYGEAVLRRYFNASLQSVAALKCLMGTFSFQSVSGVHGMYVPEGLVGEVARRRGVRLVSWNPAYRKQTFIFSHNDTYHRTMLDEPTANWENMSWTVDTEREIVDYLKSRWYGTNDWVGYTQDWSDDVASVAAELGIDFTKPCIGLLTNVIWDAQVFYAGNAFPNMLDWTVRTVEYFRTRPELQLIIRVHPAEIRGALPSRQLIADELKRAVPDLPRNVFVIPPDSRMNTYAAMLKCDAVIIYGTKAGVELSSLGIPIIVAGEAWIRNKGLTLDASSPAEYYELLDRLPLKQRMDDVAVERAKKYAYHYFFRRLIPLPVRHSSGRTLYELDISSLDDLLPGKHAGLDVVCDGILNGSEFIYPAETYPHSAVMSGKFSAGTHHEIPATRVEKPLVSVILPTQRHPESLKEALDSIAAQEGLDTEFSIERIVIGNWPSDRVSYGENDHGGVRYFQSRGNSSALKNLGIRASNGKYVAFLDADEVWLPNRLRSHVTLLEQYPEFSAVYGQFISTGSGKESLWPDAGNAPAGSVFKEFLLRESVFPSVLTVRKESFDKAGYFDESLDGMEDYDMFLRLSFFIRFGFVAGPLVRRRFSYKDLLSTRIAKGEHQRELPQILKKAFRLLPVTPENIELSREVVRHWFFEVADSLDKMEKPELLRSYVLQTLGENPWMMKESRSRERIVGYVMKALFHDTQANYHVITSGVRSFCEQLKNSQNGHYAENAVEVRRFLGDALTQTAGQMWDRGNIRAAGYTASYAALYDISQPIRQLRGAYRRLVQSIHS